MCQHHRGQLRLSCAPFGERQVRCDERQASPFYRCDRLVDDVEALREHLGLTRIDLLAH
jgi:pimeloyl-ACP methyl ester carboxylesterase